MTSEGSRTEVDLALPVSVAAVNDYELIIDGIATMLGRFPGQVDVAERIVIGEPVDHPPIHVALYDTYGRVGIAGQALDRLRRHRDILHVAMFTLELNDQLIADARRHGATGFISKTLPAEVIVDAILRVAAGEEVVARGTDEAITGPPALDELDWPGKADGLTERESQVLVLASEGLTNAEIGAALYLGRETVKTYLSRAYARLGVRNRAEAVRFLLADGAFARFRSSHEALDQGDPVARPEG
ncbi:response regulator transcription factor [Iamia sp. SCSIO 61187]|uniref:response regulator transcription factor n=1 Tax=Iamia sp. SCSIO 61187 TaxID=2722752 RepID=UPI001C628A1E|nr:response regulator transcription factor [Iamia sp. SCSIO 61187]QYG94937.1 response regulator transcription factor [Iamia sp. SCSIO 61187]